MNAFRNSKRLSIGLTAPTCKPCTRRNSHQMIARKDALKLRLTVMRDLLKHVVENDRYGRQEIKYVRTVDVGELRKVTDNYSKQLETWI